jgi:hypothetical protein
MRTSSGLIIACACLALAPAVVHAQGQRPLVDAAATKLVQKYQTSSCEQLAAERKSAKAPEKEASKQRVGELLRQNPQVRQEFVAKVAAPIAEKMIVCGFIP